jgi:WD40 repeat protein
MRLPTFAVLFAAGAVLAAAQPGKDKKPPALPAVNPAVARLETTLGDLAGPAFDLAAGGANDNELVAVACEQGVIDVFRKDALAKAGKPQTWQGHQGPVIALAYQGGPVLASAGTDKKIILWKAPEGKILQTIPGTARLRCLAMSPDGKWLAAGGEDNVVQLWEVAGAKPAAKLPGHTDWVLCLAFSPDGKQLASGALDGTIRLWEVPGGKKLADLPAKTPPPPKTAPLPAVAVHSLAFTPDSKGLLYGGADGPVHFINLPDGKAVRTLTGHTGPVTAIRFHPSGSLLATASKDRTVMLWNPAQPQPLKKLEGHTAWALGLAFIDQGQRLASAGADRTLRIWDLTEAKKKK